MNRLTSKAITLAALMAALGNILSLLTTQLAPIAPNIPLGPITVNLALDLSHLATFISAALGGPALGAVTGALGGLVAAFEFGFSKGNLVTGFGLPLGKALTGLAGGFLLPRHTNRVLETSARTLASYIPEALLTLSLFRFLLPPLMGLPVGLSTLIGLQIVVKACFEMVVLGLLLNWVLGHPALKALAGEAYVKPINP